MTIAALVARGPLHMGASGPGAKELQLALAARGYPLHGTGYFGVTTDGCVKAFQTMCGLPSTGLVDRATADAIDRPPMPVVAPPTHMASGPPWLRTAIENIGVAEVKGKGDNPIIMAMAKTCGGLIAREYVHDEIAWCKMFTEFCLMKNGLHGIDTLWALDNLKVGTKLSGPAVGALASKKRTGGGHTFIVAGRDAAGFIVGVGGNQGDRVSRATFKQNEIEGFNWPDGYPLPIAIGFAKLPIVDSAPLSKREA
jgi:uncharacterized protein (TIGR02594 family)